MRTLPVRSRMAALAALLAVATACGGTPPAGPSPQPTPTPTPANPPPIVEGITASAPRTEVNGTVTMTATVRDNETPAAQLQYAWRADAGTFEGVGATVTWRAPREVPAPTNYAITLTVTEVYDAGTRQNVVNANGPAVRVHDSVKELSALAMTFLGDFANSSVSPSAAVRDFSVNCGGREAERRDIEDNRRRYEMLGSSLRVTSAGVNSTATRGDVTVACSFTSRVIRCDPFDPEDPETWNCVVGAVGTASGSCLMTGVYEQDRWWLCDSNYRSNGVAPPGFRSFFSRQR